MVLSFFSFFLGIEPPSCDADILENILSSQVVSGIFILMSFGSWSHNLVSFELDNCTDLFFTILFPCPFSLVCVPDSYLSDDGSDIVLFFFSLFVLLQLNQNLIYFLKFFLFLAFFFSWLLSSIESLTGVLEDMIPSLYCSVCFNIKQM